MHRLTAAAALLAVAVLAHGCVSKTVTQCMSTGAPGALVTGARSLRLDVYGADAHCDGALLRPGAGAPQWSRTFAPGQALSFDVPTGRHAVVLTSFADAAQTQPLGTSCIESDFTDDAQLCFDVKLAPAAGAVDGGTDAAVVDAAPDLSPCTGSSCACQTDAECVDPARPRCGPAKVCVACLPTADNCPPKQYCATDLSCSTGCKQASDCASSVGSDAGMPSQPLCDTTRHVCVECFATVDCPAGRFCTASGACVLGCDPQLGKTCPVGSTCCNHQCVNVATDPNNCSGCGNTCGAGQTLCCAGHCTNPLTDPMNCGGCGVQCVGLNGTPKCASGMCGWSCFPGFAHCAQGNTGCETSTSSTSNCGGCGNVCNTAHASGATCNGVTCAYSCLPGFANCNTTAPNTGGCDTPTTTTTSCGGCGVTCKLVHALAATCDGTKCSYTCAAGFANCVQVGANTEGCETSTTSITSCGGCGNKCDTALSLGAGCDGKTCTYTGCKAGQANCDKTPPDTNGCETYIYSAQSCTGCGLACDTKTSINPFCTGTTCAYGGCKPGFADCNTAPPNVDGCETSITTPQSCTGCGLACDTIHSNGPACTGTTCTYASCKAGFADCKTAPPDLDGCETPTTTIANCGGCGNACDVMFSFGAQCSGGATCTYTSCAAGYSDCNKDAPNTNGCECPTPACCGLSCQTIHSNGIGQSYYDCGGLGIPGNETTYTLAMATAAANAWPVGGSTGSMTCGDSGADCLLRKSGNACAVWCYDTALAGHVRQGDASCACPQGSDPQWN